MRSRRSSSLWLVWVNAPYAWQERRSCFSKPFARSGDASSSYLQRRMSISSNWSTHAALVRGPNISIAQIMMPKLLSWPRPTISGRAVGLGCGRRPLLYRQESTHPLWYDTGRTVPRTTSLSIPDSTPMTSARCFCTNEFTAFLSRGWVPASASYVGENAVP